MAKGEILEVDGEKIIVAQTIEAKHKMAARDFDAGELATMYGVVVGETTMPVSQGSRLTMKNLAHRSAEFGEQIAHIVEGVSNLTNLEFNSKSYKQAKNFQKLFFAMSKDMRVMIIKLADRLHN
ncbi:MAG: HD domain-containing protein, partial [Opitutales bacterium]